MKDCAIKTSEYADGRQILGFVDDEKSLHFQWVYGFLVLVGLDEAPQLIARKKINRVVIVSELLPEIRVAIQEIATRSAIKLSEWKTEEHEAV